MSQAILLEDKPMRANPHGPPHSIQLQDGDVEDRIPTKVDST